MNTFESWISRNPQGLNLEGSKVGSEVGTGISIDAIEEKEFSTLAIVALYVLDNICLPSFPSTSVEAPSSYVDITLKETKSLKDGYFVKLPFRISSEYWHQAVLPVLVKERWKKPLIEIIKNYDYSNLVELMRQDLVKSFVKNKFYRV